MNPPYPILRKYEYPKLEAITFPTGGRVYITPSGFRVPSVTTILSTLPKIALEEWRLRVGEEESTRITEEACRIGSSMHDQLEGYVSAYLQGKPDIKPNTEEEKLAYAMAQRIRRFALTDLDFVWGIEEALYCNDLYAGRTDLIGSYLGKTSIIDYKSTRKPKREEWIECYKMQLGAYNIAHREMFNEGMEQGVILMAVRPPSTRPIQTFILDKSEMDRYEDKWLEVVELYYKNITK